MTGFSDFSGKPNAGAVFATTHWSVVIGAAVESSPAAEQALSQLCESYWFPLYAYVRRQGHNPDEAQDLTQEFFKRLLAGNYLKTADPKKGRFRTFLLAAMEHFLAKQWRDARRQKRGGGQVLLSLDEQDAEARYLIEPAHEIAPEHLFERKWALTLIDRVFQRLKEEFVAANKLRLFEVLQPLLTGDRTDSTYAAIGTQLDMTEGAVKVAVHRLRARYGSLVREEIAQTVSSPDEVDQELNYLLQVLGR
jgi:RNA polymerase sigma factor (sigma-70 family)